MVKVGRGICLITVFDTNESQNKGSNYFSKIIKFIRRSGVQYSHEEKECEIVEQIIKKADKNKIIVMKASDMSPIKRIFKGSIPLSVMNECDVPILIVK